MKMIDQIYPFQVNNGVVQVNSMVGIEGELHLQCILGAAYLTKGVINKEQAEAAVAGSPVPGWDLAGSNVTGISQMFWDGNQSSFTVFSPEHASGYVRIVVCE